MVSIQGSLVRSLGQSEKYNNNSINIAVGSRLDKVTCPVVYEVLSHVASIVGVDVVDFCILPYLQCKTYSRSDLEEFDTTADCVGHYRENDSGYMEWIPLGDCVFNGAMIYGHMYDNEGIPIMIFDDGRWHVTDGIRFSYDADYEGYLMDFDWDL